MNSIHGRKLIKGENDPDYEALVKMGRQTNIFSKIFWGFFFFSFPFTLIYLMICVADNKFAAQDEFGTWIMFLPVVFGFLAIIAERIGERWLDFKDRRESQKQTDILISRMKSR